MAVDIVSSISDLGTTGWILILIIFVLFVLSMKKVFRIVMNAIWIIVAAFIFPVFANRVLGLSVPADIDTILLLAGAGLAAYFVYMVAKSIYSLLGFAEKMGKKMPKIETKNKEKAGKKKAMAEKPALGKPIEKQFFAQAGKTKSEKEMFKNYVVIEDKQSKEIDFKKTKIGRDEYVEIEDESAVGKSTKEKIKGSKENGEDIFDDSGEEPVIEEVSEIKFRRKSKNRRKK